MAFSADPTAQTSLAERLATAASWLFHGDALGLATTVQGAVCACAAGTCACAASNGINSIAAAPARRRTFSSFTLILISPALWAGGQPFGGTAYGTNSYAPMSQAGPCGRATPRWSVGGQPLPLVPP